jgi:hypothetical protein
MSSGLRQRLFVFSSNPARDMSCGKTRKKGKFEDFGDAVQFILRILTTIISDEAIFPVRSC